MSSSLCRSLVVALPTLLACESILDIRDAKVDPSLLGQAGGGASNEPRDDLSGGFGADGTSRFDAGDTDADAGGDHTHASAGSSAAGTNSDAGSAGAGGTMGMCDEYCDTVAENCAGDYAVYTDRSVCMAVCATLTPGEPGAQTGNSLHCRLRAAQAATIEVPFYCPIAGPGGNGTCGTDCEGLCQVFQAVCVGENAAYPSEQACLSECKALKNLGMYTVALEADHHKGNHVQCRLYHVSAAATNPDEHCTHASGKAPCDAP